MSWISDNVPCECAGLVRNEYLGPDPDCIKGFDAEQILGRHDNRY